MILEFSHVNFLLSLHEFLVSILTDFPSRIYGQAVHDFPHLLIPFNFLLGYFLVGSGTLALINMSLRLLCLLNAVRGGSGNTEARY